MKSSSCFLTSMAKWKLFFVLLLPLTVCLNREVTAETLVKTIGSEPDVTPICTNSTTITLVVCNIRTKRSREECRLLYRHGHGFEHQCDSRFKLMTENHTVFLHLMNLTPVDSGIYTCECSKPDGTFILHLNVTVEEDKDDSSSNNINRALIALSGVAIFIIITGVILGSIHRRRRHGKRSEPLSTRPNLEPENIEPYSTFTRKESGLYSTTRVHVSNSNPSNSTVFTREDSPAENSLQNPIYITSFPT